jgi:S-adenosylmethionine:tRNA ribosyltransferase-isomerase
LEDSESAKSPYDLEAYAYDIPEGLIAQNPTDVRGDSRMMRLSREGGRVEHRMFSDLPRILRPGDLLVLNDAKVFRARVKGRKMPTGAAAEIFFLSPTDDPQTWVALVRPGRKLPPGSTVEVSGGIAISVCGRFDDGSRLVRVKGGITPDELFERHGIIPLPPYIKHSSAPEERYQTVYSSEAEKRSVASPTAGLHFTPELLDSLKKNGIEAEFITLDVGIGTFRPVKARDIREHNMHEESCAVSERCADRINEAKSRNGRIIAVGTTVVRTLESFAADSGRVSCGSRVTGIFIKPGYRFKCADAMITNFHLPKSTLLMLVSAFAGYDATMGAYREAVREGYRFFSFGDAMLIE